MRSNLPVPANEPDPDITEWDYTTAAIMDSIVDEVPSDVMEDMLVLAQSGREFFAAMQATIHLMDLVKDHNDRRRSDAAQENT